MLGQFRSSGGARWLIQNEKGQIELNSSNVVDSDMSKKTGSSERYDSTCWLRNTKHVKSYSATIIYPIHFII